MGRLSRNVGCPNGLEPYGHVQVYTMKARVQIVICPDNGKLSPGYINLLQFQTGDRFSVPGCRIFVFPFGYETGSAKLCMRPGPGRSFKKPDNKLVIWRRFTITTVLKTGRKYKKNYRNFKKLANLNTEYDVKKQQPTRDDSCPPLPPKSVTDED